MRSFQQRDARAITFRQLLLFLLAHLVRVVELLEKLVRILDAIDSEIEVVNVLITGPQPRGFVRRVSLVRRQRKIRLRAGDSWRLWLRGRRFSRFRAFGADDVEAEDGKCQR